MKPFNLQEALSGKPVVTRDGKKIDRILHLPDARVDYRVLAIRTGEMPLGTSENGRYYPSLSENRNDIFMATEKKEGWVNIYPESHLWDGCRAGEFRYAFAWTTKAQADASAKPDRIACVRIEWEE